MLKRQKQEYQELRPAWVTPCVGVPSALPEEQSLVPRVPAEYFTTSYHSRFFQGSLGVPEFVWRTLTTFIH
ncbi:mCG147279 [Mus musculus]|nr:mCG147279 [Mus musculus]